ncbi:hypothetical protein GF420_10560 [candidate division GN15 bacterium]|jgi:hypothetical protein|nr:hypothetical protein [candidate division GN15 bacterium]
MDWLTSISSRIFFAAAVIVLIIGVIDWILRLFDWTFSWVPYEPGRMLTFSAVLMIYVAVLLLRQIREQTRGSAPKA